MSSNIKPTAYSCQLSLSLSKKGINYLETGQPNNIYLSSLSHAVPSLLLQHIQRLYLILFSIQSSVLGAESKNWVYHTPVLSFLWGNLAYVQLFGAINLTTVRKKPMPGTCDHILLTAACSRYVQNMAHKVDLYCNHESCTLSSLFVLLMSTHNVSVT